MDEYIERKAVIRYVENQSVKMWGNVEKEGTLIDAYELIDDLSDIPSADVAPVVHGRWISKNPNGYEWIFVCSNCDYVDGYPFNDRHNYCPNCGAKMDSEDGGGRAE